MQEPLIRYAVEVGWEYLPPEEALLPAYFHEKYPDLELPDLRGHGWGHP